MITVCTFALIDQREQAFHSRAIQVLGRLAAIHDQLGDLGSLHGGHGSDFRFLRFERNVVISLLFS
jgi:hypothetical protein